ncbi:hypothetical protein RIF29_10912 [Crotalaria pallida]|uniref:Aminotransferase-like plant mobile domain-containing protein n=1 Tax=Crotalaria pallida TaxID=3830 RepID=A0AAN9ILT2_CROPI
MDAPQTIVAVAPTSSSNPNADEEGEDNDDDDDSADEGQDDMHDSAEEGQGNGDDSNSEEEEEQEEIPNPQDMTLLRSFANHVARDIWQGINRVVLGRSTNRKWCLPLMSGLPEEVKVIVRRLGLRQLVNGSYEQVDMKLLNAFAERWYPDTNTFHLPVGEMTVTLDDVSSILHIPVFGRLIPWKKPGKEDGASLMTQHLGIDAATAAREVKQNRGGAIRFITLSVVLCPR